MSECAPLKGRLYLVSHMGIKPVKCKLKLLKARLTVYEELLVTYGQAE
jgi:hypothetical protein